MTASYVAANAGEQLLIKLGDGADPEVFTVWALVNTDRAVSLTANATATEIPRVDDPSAPAKIEREVISVDSSISGSGLVDTAGDKIAADWLLSGQPKNVKVYNNLTGGLVLTGAYVIVKYDMTGKRGGKIENTFQLDGADLPVTSAAT